MPIPGTYSPMCLPPSRNKSRIEEINEIIARSQIQAQHMLASSHIGADDTTLGAFNTSMLSPRIVPRPEGGYLGSPDHSHASDDVRLTALHYNSVRAANKNL